jgi:hypothetical protein
MVKVDKIAEALLETNARLREQTRKSPKHLLMILSELSKSCAVAPVIRDRVEFEVAEARKVTLFTHDFLY